MVLFLEEDHIVTEDLVSMLQNFFVADKVDK
jgi:hypothetical protein